MTRKQKRTVLNHWGMYAGLILTCCHHVGLAEPIHIGFGPMPSSVNGTLPFVGKFDTDPNAVFVGF